MCLIECGYYWSYKECEGYRTVYEQYEYQEMEGRWERKMGAANSKTPIASHNQENASEIDERWFNCRGR